MSIALCFWRHGRPDSSMCLSLPMTQVRKPFCYLCNTCATANTANLKLYVSLNDSNPTHAKCASNVTRHGPPQPLPMSHIEITGITATSSQSLIDTLGHAWYNMSAIGHTLDMLLHCSRGVSEHCTRSCLLHMHQGRKAGLLEP